MAELAREALAVDNRRGRAAGIGPRPPGLTGGHYGGRDRSVREPPDRINPAVANGSPPDWARPTWSGLRRLTQRCAGGPVRAK